MSDHEERCERGILFLSSPSPPLFRGKCHPKKCKLRGTNDDSAEKQIRISATNFPSIRDMDLDFQNWAALRSSNASRTASIKHRSSWVTNRGATEKCRSYAPLDSLHLHTFSLTSSRGRLQYVSNAVVPRRSTS